MATLSTHYKNMKNMDRKVFARKTWRFSTFEFPPLAQPRQASKWKVLSVKWLLSNIPKVCWQNLPEITPRTALECGKKERKLTSISSNFKRREAIVSGLFSAVAKRNNTHIFLPLSYTT